MNSRNRVVGLQGKSILVAVTGGIAAYKVGELVRLLSKDGADVQVVMTAAAKAFVQPLTFQALTGRPVRDSLLDPSAEQGMGHIELARWADMIIVAPASADAIARISMGLANDLLTTVVLASQAPLAIAPAMNQAMWSNSITQYNLQRLCELRPGVQVWGPAEGDQACGDYGPGRMLEALDIWHRARDFFAVPGLLSGLKVTITAGPTRERIDPVRYISNDSSGKMGYALAEAAAKAGAQVTLISGPVTLETPAGVALVAVESATQMLDASLSAIQDGTDIFIGSAAVADYRLDTVASQKIKKSAAKMQLNLIRNPDVLGTVAAADSAPFCVGFAAETECVVEYATEKLQRKKLQMIVANDVSRSDIGFNSDDNAVMVITPGGVEALEKMPKPQLAKVLIEQIASRYGALKGIEK